MGLSPVAAYQYVGTHLHGVVATNERDVVGEFVVAQDAKVGQEDIPVKQTVAGDVEPWAPGIVRNDVELVVRPLHPGLILRSRTEQLIPGTLHGAIPHPDLIAT